MGPVQFGASNMRSFFEQSRLLQAHDKVQVGQYFFTKAGDQDWPVVICDEDIVKKYFNVRKRPDHARLADGTWGKDYEPGGKHADRRSYPALVPGQLTLFWPRWEDLEPFDAEMGLILKETTTSKSLATAWEEAIVSEKNGKGIDHWKRKLAAKHGIDDGKSPESRKRKGTPDFKLPPAYTREEPVDDEEGAYAFLPAWTNTEPKIKNEFHTTTGLDQKGELFKDHDSPNAGYAAQLNKRSKLDIAGRFSRPGTPVKNEGHSRGAISLAASKIRSTPFQPIMGTNDIDQTKVIVYIGNPHMAFQCRRAALDASSLLSGLAINHPDNGWYVMSPMLSSMDPDDFFPVGQYLARGEYNPNLLDDNTEWVRLERELEGDTRNEEVIRCGKIYCTAQKLEVSGLQDLAFRKLKALAKDTPYEAFAILCVTALAFTIGNEDLRQYLVRYLAEHFMEMIPVAGEKLVEVMTSDGDLQRSVFGLMSGILPEVQDAGVEGVQKEETEGKEGDVGGVTGAEVLGSAGLGGDEVEDERVRMDMREFVKMREQEEAFQPLD